MKLVILDAYTANPGDLEWPTFSEFSTVNIYPRTSTDEFYERCEGASAILTNKVHLDRSRMESIPTLKYIGVTATGYNIIDIETAKDLGITVCNVPEYCSTSVAQATFSLILELCNHTGQHNLAVKSGDWTQSPDFCFWQKPLIELAGKTFGIVGYGNIGQAVIRIAQAFGMKTIVHTRTEYASPLVEFVDKKTLFENSDIISLHCPLTDKTDKLVDEYHLSLMKKDAYIINTSRGALIDENALAHALNNDRIAGAGLDVLGLEPPSEDNPLLKAKNTIITPHVAWATHSARKRLIEISYNNLISFLNGQPINCLTQ